MYQKIAVMGSTGSIGVQTLDVMERLGLEAVSLSASGRNLALLEQQARKFRPALVAVQDETAAEVLKQNLADTDIRVVGGTDGVCEAASIPSAELTSMSILGMAGLLPTLAAIDAGKDIALATKETLVCAGSLVTARAKEKNIRILPVDSEHSAIFQCLEGSLRKQVKKILLTASGGPFFGRSREETYHYGPKDALKHPNWSMGQKITIDSATLMNKGFEFLEAMWLYDLTPDQIEIVVHRESVIHSMVEFDDNAVLAQLGTPDMRLPIQYAITYPDRIPCPAPALDFKTLRSLTFYEPDPVAFPCLQLALDCARSGGNRGAVLNGANEIAVAAFLKEQIPFGQISELVEDALHAVPYQTIQTLDDVLAADRLAREHVRRTLVQI